MSVILECHLGEQSTLLDLSFVVRKEPRVINLERRIAFAAGNLINGCRVAAADLLDQYPIGVRALAERLGISPESSVVHVEPLHWVDRSVVRD